MKKFGFISLCTLASSIAFSAPFTPGNIVVLRTGDGTAAVANMGYQGALVEINPTTGSVVQTIDLPNSGGDAICFRGDSTTEGHMSLNAGYFAFIGFNAANQTPLINQSTMTTVARVVGLVDLNGNVDLSTKLVDSFQGSASSSAAPRSAVTSNGTDIWVAGNGSASTSAGVRYLTKGSTTSTRIFSGNNNTRVVNIYNGQLYMSSGGTGYNCVSSIGTGLPTTTGQTGVNLFPSGPTSGATEAKEDFVFADANTLYVADDSSLSPVKGIAKYVFSAGTWNLQWNNDGGFTGIWARSLAVTKDGSGNNVLYFNIQSGAAPGIYKMVDTGAGAPYTLVTAQPANYTFKGLEYIPVTGTTISGTLDLNGFVGPAQVPGTFQVEVRTGSGTETKSVTVATDGTYSFVSTSSGAATIWFKGALWLGKAVSTTISGSALTVNAALVNGDCNNDNHVDASDYFILSDAYETNVGDSAYNAVADLSGDGTVDASDYFILSDAYEKDGDN